ncbi:MAG TPA: gamma-glutamylcyclotransferase family protein [Roseiarcus sp.]|nr:gamma-glutamylcyclotransferase family protein [Roseiarcus sp.]
MLYIAYGSNLHIGQMRQRCPRAIKVGSTKVPNTRLVFRGVADVEPCDGATLHVGVWHITQDCERSLDVYEGVRHGLYRKEYLPLQVRRNGRETIEDALIYIMNRGGYHSPSQFYFDTIRIGYDNFGLPVDALKQAAKLSRKLERAQMDERADVLAGKWELMP